MRPNTLIAALLLLSCSSANTQEPRVDLATRAYDAVLFYRVALSQYFDEIEKHGSVDPETKAAMASEYRSRMIDYLRETYTPDELSALIDFYSTEPGSTIARKAIEHSDGVPKIIIELQAKYLYGGR
ncbi:MAG: DUF2059 domain-containing protein, partial [Pseudomonadales bacterium]